MTEIGVNFRQTSSYVTDGANEVGEYEATGQPFHILPTYPRTTLGVTLGWESPSGGQMFPRDRNTSPDRRIAGFWSGDISGGNKVFAYRIDLDGLSGAGSYDIQLGSSDANYGAQMYAELFDTNLSLGVVVNDLTGITGQAIDATPPSGAVKSRAQWVTDTDAGTNKVTKTFSTTIFRLKVGDPSDGSAPSVSHIHLVSVAAPPPVVGTRSSVNLRAGLSPTVGVTLHPIISRTGEGGCVLDP